MAPGKYATVNLYRSKHRLGCRFCFEPAYFLSFDFLPPAPVCGEECLSGLWASYLSLYREVAVRKLRRLGAYPPAGEAASESGATSEEPGRDQPGP